MSATLLIDISNSAVKATSTDGFTLGGKRTHPTAEFDSTWLAALAAETAATRAVVSSVVPEKTAVARDVFGKSLLEVSPEIELGIAIDYPEPATIGPDRLANAAAFAAIHNCPGVVVD
ncbi:type III pantothenate kinase, partial [Verrucomicrobiales bacterium]|nr:type III pantothenate kinase [Verrucomicrobiales bacterium]